MTTLPHAETKLALQFLTTFGQNSFPSCSHADNDEVIATSLAARRNTLHKRLVNSEHIHRKALEIGQIGNILSQKSSSDTPIPYREVAPRF